jgi:hypothetical protein
MSDIIVLIDASRVLGELTGLDWSTDFDPDLADHHLLDGETGQPGEVDGMRVRRQPRHGQHDPGLRITGGMRSAGNGIGVGDNDAGRAEDQEEDRQAGFHAG